LIPDPKDKLTPGMVYNRIATFFFGLLFLILAAGFSDMIKEYPWIVYVVIALFALSFWLIGFIFVDFTAYYIAKFLHHFGRSFDRYKLIYGLVVGLILLVIFVIIGYYNLSKEIFWQIIVSSGVISVIGFIAYILKEMYEKHKAKENKR
jgi:small-conductance mechanosensitive channel